MNKRSEARSHKGRKSSENDTARRLLMDSSPLTYNLAGKQPGALVASLEVLSGGVGRPWHEVLRELHSHLSGSSVSAAEFASEFGVETNPVFVAGIPQWRTTDGELRGPTGWGMELYVDEQGILRRWSS